MTKSVDPMLLKKGSQKRSPMKETTSLWSGIDSVGRDVFFLKGRGWGGGRGGKENLVI